MRMIACLIMVTVLVASASACSPLKPPTADGQAGEGQQLNTDINLNPQSYRNMSVNKSTISDDQDKIREVVEAEGYNAGAVSITGNHAWVNVNFGNAKEDRNGLKNKLAMKIYKAVPRYKIHVRAK
ncbi:hypothetical protein [Guptibacillus hwajinpoensis]|uniref:Sporulation protein n=1 Tax=Guptibacillus hwajinpoensis TaxID=208199 RepID=A0A0J6CK99_9BACL|nr:hypothetical protein [Alkalihalobacillus macyae]KMM36636.1 hypothetical protein AB986_11775 [Alkalihalobacillus macyae]